MKKIIILYYSRTGNTEEMAKLIEEGAKAEKDVDVQVKKIDIFSVKSLMDYDGIVIGSPTYYGAMADVVKKLIDESVSFHGKLEGKVGAAFASSANIGGGNETTILTILKAMLIHGMIIQGSSQGDHYGPVSIGSPDDRVKRQCRALGKKIAGLVKKIT